MIDLNSLYRTAGSRSVAVKLTFDRHPATIRPSRGVTITPGFSRSPDRPAMQQSLWKTVIAESPSSAGGGRRERQAGHHLLPADTSIAPRRQD